MARGRDVIRGNERFKTDESGLCVGQRVIHARLRWRGVYQRMSLGKAVCKTSPRDDSWVESCRWEPSDLIPYEVPKGIL